MESRILKMKNELE
jgi:hypothetical protein